MGDNPRVVENILVTGATNGIGKGIVETLVAQGKNVYVTGRDQNKLDNLVVELIPKKVHDDQKIVTFCFDIGRLSDVKRVMPQICEHSYDTVIFNAGVIFPVKRDPNVDDLPNLEETIKVNIIGHFLMTRYLIAASNHHPSMRFVCLSSVMASHAHRRDRWPILTADFFKFFSRSYFLSDGWLSYFDSKLAAIVMAQKINKEENMSAVAIHPGIASTHMFDSIPWFQRLLLAPVKWILRPPIEDVSICANRVIDEAVKSNNDFTDMWICDGLKPIPTTNLSQTQKDAFINFLREATNAYMA